MVSISKDNLTLNPFVSYWERVNKDVKRMRTASSKDASQAHCLENNTITMDQQRSELGKRSRMRLADFGVGKLRLKECILQAKTS